MGSAMVPEWPKITPNPFFFGPLHPVSAYFGPKGLHQFFCTPGEFFLIFLLKITFFDVTNGRGEQKSKMGLLDPLANAILGPFRGHFGPIRDKKMFSENMFFFALNDFFLLAKGLAASKKSQNGPPGPPSDPILAWFVVLGQSGAQKTQFHASCLTWHIESPALLKPWFISQLVKIAKIQAK